jgi:hypothetical protein
MHAYFDTADGKPKVDLEIEGTASQPQKITALLDTGHTGKLSLPIKTLIELGSYPVAFGSVLYGNGAVEKCVYFRVKHKIGGIYDNIDAGLTWTNEAIAGVELFAPYVLTIDFKNKTIKFEISNLSTVPA